MIVVVKINKRLSINVLRTFYNGEPKPMKVF